jgi:hypothetical protein
LEPTRVATAGKPIQVMSIFQLLYGVVAFRMLFTYLLGKIVAWIFNEKLDGRVA